MYSQTARLRVHAFACSFCAKLHDYAAANGPFAVRCTAKTSVSKQYCIGAKVSAGRRLRPNGAEVSCRPCAQDSILGYDKTPRWGEKYSEILLRQDSTYSGESSV